VEYVDSYDNPNAWRANLNECRVAHDFHTVD